MAWLNGMDFYDFNEQYPHLSAKASGLADWLAMDNNTPSDLVNNAIYIYMMEVTAYMADVIGESDYAQTLRERREAAQRMSTLLPARHVVPMARRSSTLRHLTPLR